MNTDTISTTLTADAPCHCRVAVTVPAAEVDAVLTAQLKRYRHRARLPGFRPGKAPNTLIRKRFRNEIEADARQEILTESLRFMIEKENLKPVTMPSMPRDETVVVKPGAPLAFTVEFDVSPTLTLPPYKGLPLKRAVIDVPETEVDRFLDSVRQQRQAPEQIDAPAAAGDMLKVSYSSDLGERLADIPETAKQLAAATETWVLLSEPELLPGIIAGLVGVERGGRADVTVTFPDDYRETALAGQTANYRFDVLEVHRPKMPEMDDEFARSLGLESLEQLRERSRLRLRLELHQGQLRQWQRNVIEMLDSQPDFDLPPRMLEYERTVTLSQLRRQQAEAADGAKADKPTAEELEARADAQARRQLKLRFLVERIAKAESLEVGKDEIEAQLDQVRRQSQLPEQQFRERFNVEALRVSISREMLAEKVISRVIELAEIEDTAPAAEAAAAAAPGDAPTKNGAEVAAASEPVAAEVEGAPATVDAAAADADTSE